MANSSLGTVAISMTLWLADWGAGHVQAAKTPAEPTPVVAAPAAKVSCQAGAEAPADESDLQVVVCAPPLRH